MISPNGTPPPTEDAPWQHVLANGSTPAHYIYPQAIQKSERDDREYKLIRLENGLQAMLVHDANTDKAAASLDVAIGHLSDPVSRDPPYYLLFHGSLRPPHSG